MKKTRHFVVWGIPHTRLERVFIFPSTWTTQFYKEELAMKNSQTASTRCLVSRVLILSIVFLMIGCPADFAANLIKKGDVNAAIKYLIPKNYAEKMNAIQWTFKAVKNGAIS